MSHQVIPLNTKFSQSKDENKVQIPQFNNSHKIYEIGSQSDIRVPMREIKQSDTQTDQSATQNPAITVYDTSGPYTDVECKIDIVAGLPSVRGGWVDARGDTEAYTSGDKSFKRPSVGNLPNFVPGTKANWDPSGN